MTNVKSVTEYRLFLPKTLPKTFSRYIGKVVDGSKSFSKTFREAFLTFKYKTKPYLKVIFLVVILCLHHS